MAHKELSDKFLENIIINVGDIVKELGYTMNDLSNVIGYNASTYSRNRNNVIKQGYKRDSHMSYAINLLVGLDNLIFSTQVDNLQLRRIEKLIFNEMLDTTGIGLFKASYTEVPVNSSWYVINLSKRKGLVHQWSMLKNLEIDLKKKELTDQIRNSFASALAQIQEAYITIPGLLQLKRVNLQLDSFSCKGIFQYIQKEISESKQYEIQNLKLHISSVIRNKIYHGDWLEGFLDDVDIIEETSLPDTDFDTDFVRDITALYNVYSKIEDYKLLIVQDQREYQNIMSTFISTVTDKVIFAYVTNDGNSIVFIFNDIVIPVAFTLIGKFKELTNGVNLV